MSLLTTTYLLNSIGSVLMWIMLGPHVVAQGGGINTLGHLGMVRQLSFIAGAILGGSLADRGRPVRKQLIVECVQLVTTVALLWILEADAREQEGTYLAWSTLRFGMSGMSFVLGFRILAQSTRQLGNASILHLLVTQGANLLAPLIALTLPLISHRPLHLALSIDGLTTAAYALVLLRARGGSLDLMLEGQHSSLGQRIGVAVSSFWDAKLRPWNFLQLLLLVAMSGYAVISLETARRQTHVSVELGYALCSFTYGVALWTTSIWLTHIKSFRRPILLGTCLLALAGAAFLFESTPPLLLVGAYLSYVFGFWITLHSSNKAILSIVPIEKAGVVRSSMVFYLSVIFGIGEFFFGSAFGLGHGAVFTAGLRLGTAALLLIFLILNWRTLDCGASK